MYISIYPIDSVSLENPKIELYSLSLLGNLRAPSEEAWAILGERPGRERGSNIILSIQTLCRERLKHFSGHSRSPRHLSEAKLDPCLDHSSP